jgi:hypothetical protein
MWPGRVKSSGRAVGSASARAVAILGGDAGAGARVDRDGERRAVRVGVLGHHQRQLERVGALGRHRDADDPGRVPQQERELLGRRELGRHDEIGLVLAIGRVGDDDEATAPDCLDCLLEL